MISKVYRISLLPRCISRVQAARCDIRVSFCVLFVISLISCARPNTEWIPADETDHFTFFTHMGSEDAVPPLANELEANYDRITQDLQATTADKFSVYIFEDIDTFHQARDVLTHRHHQLALYVVLTSGWSLHLIRATSLTHRKS